MDYPEMALGVGFGIFIIIRSGNRRLACIKIILKIVIVFKLVELFGFVRYIVLEMLNSKTIS